MLFKCGVLLGIILGVGTFLVAFSHVPTIEAIGLGALVFGVCVFAGMLFQYLDPDTGLDGINE